MIISSHILSDLDELTTEMIYIFEGKVQYNNSIDFLKRETNETRLNKAVTTMIKQKELLMTLSVSQALWDELLNLSGTWSIELDYLFWNSSAVARQKGGGV